MLASFFKTTPLVDQNTHEWILDTFAWALEHYDLLYFKEHSQLILPDNVFYPGNVSAVHQMADNIFKNTLKYVGMQQWPIKLVPPSLYQAKNMPILDIKGEYRGTKSYFSPDSPVIEVSYNENQINQPQDLIASFAQTFSTILIVQSKQLPPGGVDFLPQAIDLVACFMGFGVMFANTAYQFKGGCGSCFNPRANRTVALPENEMLYCLALFCQLKSIKTKAVTPFLKSHLKSPFKKVLKELTKSIPETTQPALLAAQY